ncbi:putative 6-phosphogluconolactonase [Leptospirillum ferrooxidans C2-3]|uniref:Putative 6-phosphogluconolactonase n=1 Tax=Leptospirillum ferrooxidans (strain C2-3) TaxID=1162668 RepID=I0IRL3_LEPFC|nr:putative 6-phosphogluconolactonase [Leptospirillum ferrooxidans C2-3]
MVFLLDPNASLAFALNSNSSPSSFQNGLIESYNTSTAQSTTGITSTSYTRTGTNPTSMAVDPGGNYLVVANHGSGTTNSSTGDVEIFGIGSNGALSGPTILSSLPQNSCPNPDKIVFPPSGSNGTTSDTFYVVCSSPELISSSPPTPALYRCQISGSCSTNLLSSFPNSNAISNMEFASNGTAFLPGETYSSSSSSYNAFLITCNGTPLSSCTSPTPISSATDTAPAGDFAIYNGSPPTAFIGNYSTSVSGTSTVLTNPGVFFSCAASSCSNLSYPSSSGDPTYLATGPGQANLYIVSTPDPLPTDTSNISNSPSGSIYYCSLPTASACTQTGTTSNYPVGITFDPSGKFAFVPTWSGTISIFQVGSNGALTPAASPVVTTGNLNLQVVVP